MRRKIITVAVVALLVFSGCSAIDGGGDGTTTQTGPDGTTASDAGDTSDPLYETPLDGETVAENHEAVVAEANSFTLVSTSNQSRGNQSASSQSTLMGVYDSGEYSSVQQARGRTVEQYVFANGSAYQRFEQSTGDAQYTVPRRTANASTIATGQVASFVDAFEYEFVGTETVDGTETQVYEASGVEDLNTSAPGFSELDTENVTNVGAHIYVTEDGLVKQFGYELGLAMDGQEASVEVTQRFTNLGETTVEPPEWIDEARENTSDGNTTSA